LTDTWTFIGGTVSGNEISVAVDRLGRYGLFFGPADEPADIDILASVSLIPRVIRTRGGSMDEQLKVSFTTSRPTNVVAKIYDTNGRLIRTLADGLITDIGSQLLNWDGQRGEGGYANDGLYVLVIEAEGKKIQKTFVILNN
ncbi:MAG: T9SS type A sorting domain-containing protein, partial [candidate division Zixibacteria bacterium]|nr:T9SS type A sorting domain-containing protein [candidate division Zixibacteria bacterium]